MQPVPMVPPATPARSRTPPLPHRVRVVETDQPGAVRGVQRQRVAEPMRPFRSDFDSHHDELHSVSGFVHEQGLTVKLQQGVESGIAGTLIEIVITF